MECVSVDIGKLNKNGERESPNSRTGKNTGVRLFFFPHSLPTFLWFQDLKNA